MKDAALDPFLIPDIRWVESLYQQYEEDPDSVSPSWKNYFASLEKEKPKPPIGNEKEILYSPTISIEAPSDLRIDRLIAAYRTYGHLFADINPIDRGKPKRPSQLSLENLGFTEEEREKTFPTCGFLRESEASLQQIVDALEETYCGTIGIEYIDIHGPHLEKWVQEHVEPNRCKKSISVEEKQMILEELNKSELLETFIHKKYTGQKRFSLEGAETLIPMLKFLLYQAIPLGIEEIVLGMPHRGRLNVLANILQKSYTDIFAEFDPHYLPEGWEGSGDVKYHKGFSAQVRVANERRMKMTLSPNPSHLESVDPVVQGQARAKYDEGVKVLPILIHGDAALAGQGVVYETLQLSRLPAYTTGGTLHFVINNQIGFTTLPSEGRSTFYCTDIAKAFGAPIFHVNAEDPEGCLFATELALAIRQKFACDVFVELNGWRKYGHNETDEPGFTQPLEYQIIRNKKPVREQYRDFLIHEGAVEKYMADSLEKEFQTSLHQALQAKEKTQERSTKKIAFREKEENKFFTPFESGVDKDRLKEMAEALSSIPKGLTVHPKLARLVKERHMMITESQPIDWGMAELLAYGSLLLEGINIRLAGQDSRRGTFSHRHAVWTDQEREQTYVPLRHLREGQGEFSVVNSPLSEMATLGFEYGYSLSKPETLVIWEAQFGDFANGAQVMIDQYIATGENKWAQRSGLVLFLPHGYEGQGPEHSSARIERFLQLAANANMVITYPTTPAQFFHLLRRHRLSPIRKPLIVFTPKELLRHSRATSRMRDFETGQFMTMLLDESEEKAQILVFCVGRIYYDLLIEREKRERKDIALVRIEQLYPLDKTKIKEILEKNKWKRVLFVQDEPENMGAWPFLSTQLLSLLPKALLLEGVMRPRSASPATGSHAIHEKEHMAIMHQVFSPGEEGMEDRVQPIRI